MGLTPPRLEAMDLVFVWCGSGPVLCSFAVFSAGESHLALDGKKNSLLANANLAGRFADRRCCRVFSRCFGFSMMCLVYEALFLFETATVFARAHKLNFAK